MAAATFTRFKAAHVRAVFTWGKPVIHIQHKPGWRNNFAKVGGIRDWAEKFRPAKPTWTKTHTFCRHRHWGLLMWGWEVGKLHVGGWSALMNASLQTHTSAGRLIKPETPFYLEPFHWCHRRAKTYKNGEIKSFSLNDGAVHVHFWTWGSSSVCATLPLGEPQCSSWLAAIDVETTSRITLFQQHLWLFPIFLFWKCQHVSFVVSIKSPVFRFTRCPKQMHWLALALNKIDLKCSPPGWN